MGGLTLFVVLLVVPAPDSVPEAGWAVAALAALMAIWWMTEAVPLAVTALLPVVLLPMLGVAPVAHTTIAYANPLVFLICGGFMIAKALERWSLHQRVAALVLRFAPRNPSGVIGAVMASTAFLSMWLSNTATAAVMMPIGISVIAAVEKGNAESDATQRFGAALVLGIAYAATIGGMSTLIGTPPNALLAGYLEGAHGLSVGFAQWMLLGVPVMIVLLPIAWLVLTRVAFKFDALKIEGIGSFGETVTQPHPPLPVGGWLTAAIVGLTGLGLVLRPVLQNVVPGFALNDAGIMMGAALVLFILPAWDGRGSRLLHWQDVADIRWDVLILFGGGLALAGAIETSGLSQSIGTVMSALNSLPLLVIVLAGMVLVVLAGEFASNTAMAAVLLPVAAAVATGLGVPVTSIVIPIGLAASLGFMLPVATPPNAMAYGAGKVTTPQMLRAGVVLDLAGVLIVYVLAISLGPIVIGA